jgi:hypothetical protein
MNAAIRLSPKRDISTKVKSFENELSYFQTYFSHLQLKPHQKMTFLSNSLTSPELYVSSKEFHLEVPIR